MVKACIKTQDEINTFRELQEKVEGYLVQKNRSEVQYGDIPDEFRGGSAVHVPCLSQIGQSSCMFQWVWYLDCRWCPGLIGHSLLHFSGGHTIHFCSFLGPSCCLHDWNPPFLYGAEGPVSIHVQFFLRYFRHSSQFYRREYHIRYCVRYYIFM